MLYTALVFSRICLCFSFFDMASSPMRTLSNLNLMEYKLSSNCLPVFLPRELVLICGGRQTADFISFSKSQNAAKLVTQPFPMSEQFARLAQLMKMNAAQPVNIPSAREGALGIKKAGGRMFRGQDRRRCRVFQRMGKNPHIGVAGVE